MFYFSTERPITPGSLPNHLKPLSVENFPEKTYCPEIEGEAWGKAEFENPLSGYEAMLSELVPQGSKHYFGVRYVRHGRQYDRSRCGGDPSCLFSFVFPYGRCFRCPEPGRRKL